MVNFPCTCPRIQYFRGERPGEAYNDAVLADLDMVTDSSCLNDGVGTDVDVISYFHRIVIEVSAVRLVRWPAGKSVSAS